MASIRSASATRGKPAASSASNGASSGAAKKPLSGAAKAYLIFYNFASMFAWAYLAYLMIDHYFVEKAPLSLMYKKIGFALKVIQTTAILEVLHCMIGLVGGSVFTTFVQGTSPPAPPSDHTSACCFSTI
jgi:hypothetical protein